VRNCLIFSFFLFLFTVLPSTRSFAGTDNCGTRLYTSVGRTVGNVLSKIGPLHDAGIRKAFDDAGVAYPPSRLTLIALKEEMRLEVWAGKSDQWVLIKTYDILAASGRQGPKRKKGDRQVPEGVYRIVDLNPNSRFHLSMKLNYPNDYDLRRAESDKRSNLGGDIYIHGKAKSSGCLAIGDAAIEELFVLVAETGKNSVKVVIAPRDFRKKGESVYAFDGPSWLPELYQNLQQEMAKFRLKDDQDQTL